MTLEIMQKKRAEGSNQLFSVRYGSVDIVDIYAKNAEEAEEKFVFVLAHELAGKVLNFDISSFS